MVLFSVSWGSRSISYGLLGISYISENDSAVPCDWTLIFLDFFLLKTELIRKSILKVLPLILKKPTYQALQSYV